MGQKLSKWWIFYEWGKSHILTDIEKKINNVESQTGYSLPSDAIIAVVQRHIEKTGAIVMLLLIQYKPEERTTLGKMLMFTFCFSIFLPFQGASSPPGGNHNPGWLHHPLQPSFLSLRYNFTPRASEPGRQPPPSATHFSAPGFRQSHPSGKMVTDKPMLAC